MKVWKTVEEEGTQVNIEGRAHAGPVGLHHSTTDEQVMLCSPAKVERGETTAAL